MRELLKRKKIRMKVEDEMRSEITKKKHNTHITQHIL